MKILRFEVLGLIGKDTALSYAFHPDINVLTGKNGSGKTSALKLLWYIMSGNILQALREVAFKKVTLQTTAYTCTIYRLSSVTCRIEWESAGEHSTFEDVRDEDGDIIFNAEDEANERLKATGSSIFLPTFRRIEGGFTLSDRRDNALARAGNDMEEMLTSLSKKLTKSNHVFVAALSTVDIVSLLFKQYTDLSEQYNQAQQRGSQEIIARIKGVKKEASDSAQLDQANRVLDQIRLLVESMEGQREAIMKPLEAVRSLAMTLFRHSGIALGKHLSFGDAAKAVNSETLSAGEKQMLSFIAYNAFYRDAVVIIDEPELSLHVDWQRQLFPILLGQHTTNQFVVATHSPFIYSKYPDRELLLDQARGDEGN